MKLLKLDEKGRESARRHTQEYLDTYLVDKRIYAMQEWEWRQDPKAMPPSGT